MPHSSGGGSHSGGISGGGFSGGGGSHSGSFDNSGSGGRRTYNHYVPGARTFVCYNHGKMDYLYANYNVGSDAKESKRIACMFAKILAVITVLFVIYGLLCAIPPSKIKGSYDTTIIIKDNAQVLDDNSALTKELEAFYDATGITPAIITVHNEDWQNHFAKLDNYAYELYVNHFSDEYHWLLVYSEPENPDSEFNDWYWAGMQGDNTDKLLNGNKLQSFNQNLQKYLTANTRYSISEAFEESFANTTPIMRKVDNLSDTILSTAMIYSFVALFVGGISIACFVEYKINKSKQYVEITNIPKEKIEEDNCEYCGGLFIRGKHLSCPHCGAAIKAKNE